METTNATQISNPTNTISPTESFKTHSKEGRRQQGESVHPDITRKVPFSAPTNFPNLESKIAKLLTETYKEGATLYTDFYPAQLEEGKVEAELFHDDKTLREVRKEIQGLLDNKVKD